MRFTAVPEELSALEQASCHCRPSWTWRANGLPGPPELRFAKRPVRAVWGKLWIFLEKLCRRWI